jgi:hypothetical protein
MPGPARPVMPAMPSHDERLVAVGSGPLPQKRSRWGPAPSPPASPDQPPSAALLLSATPRRHTLPNQSLPRRLRLGHWVVTQGRNDPWHMPEAGRHRIRLPSKQSRLDSTDLTDPSRYKSLTGSILVIRNIEHHRRTDNRRAMKAISDSSVTVSGGAGRYPVLYPASQLLQRA